ncbi:MAG: glycosyltransferase family 4 protein [Chthoniobacterales bacterium]
MKLWGWLGTRRRLRINMLVPEPHPGAGGDIGLFRIADYLAEFGHDVWVYVVSYISMNDYTTEQVRDYMREHFPRTRAIYHKWSGSARAADCTLATFWPTVANVVALPNSGKRFYIVQDFEPSFYPDVPVNYRGAEETYRAGLHCITLGRWLARLLREQYGATTNYFDFAVDPEIYRPQRRTDQQRRVCFYARPSTPRRAYATGIEALRLVKAQVPEVDVSLFGSGKLEPEPPFPYTNRGKISEHDLAQLFSNSDVGLVLSLSNPSFVPLEMLACRCAVVEIASERFEEILTHDVDSWLVEPTANAIADGVVKLLTDSALRERLAEAGYERARKMSWRKSVQQIEEVLLRETP